MSAKLEAATDAVEVRGTNIIVTKPGTDFSVTYQKRFANPNLALTDSWVAGRIDSPAISEFRSRAFQAAVAKARELGCII